MKDIIFEWNPWWSGEYSFNYIKRDKLKDIIPWLSRKEIISVLGVRRSGKTTLLYEIIEYLIKDTKVSPKNIFFIKADDDRINTDGLIDGAIDEYKKLVNPISKFFLFIDEIQEIKDWQKTIKRIYDLEGREIKLFISGSNASILKEELSLLLAGRFAYFEIFPFSFSEFLKTKNIKIKNEIDTIKNKHLIRNYLVEYVTKGSFPEVILEKNEQLKNELIHFYFDSIFYRDIIKRKKIRNPQKMEKLVKYSLQNISNLINFSKVGRLLDLTSDSVTEYIKALEDAYLIFSINLFEFSYKKQIINPKKIYCIDNGIRNIIGFNFSKDIGRLYENIVFINLKRKYNEIYYWKNKNEVDFVVKSGVNLMLIQVSYSIDSEETKIRELEGLLEAMEKFKLKEGLIITDNKEGEEKINNKKIKYIPLWKWLLDSKYY